MSETIERGTWEGNRVRTARKEGRCHYWLGHGRCPVIIKPGDKYFDGEMSLEAGGYARERFCMDHACDGTK